MTFYNTIKLKGSALEKAIERAEIKKKKVLAVFRTYPTKELTPFDVLRVLKISEKQAQSNVRHIISSVRRAMSDLTDDG